MHFVRFALLFIAAPALAAKPLPPLPPLVLDAEAPIVTVTIDGQPLRLRVDPGTTRHVEVNASAARRLGLADPARLVGGKPVDQGSTTTSVGKVTIRAVTSGEILGYAGRELPLTLAWSDRDPVAGADGQIGPWMLPHDSIRIVRRPAMASDRTTHLPMQLNSARGLLGEQVVGGDRIDILINPGAADTIATAAAASSLAASHGGQLRGKPRDVVVALGAVRPVRDVVFARPVDIAGLRLTHVAARVFDWSGKTSIPDADIAADEAVVAGRAGAQREWGKLAIGNDQLGACAEIAWTAVPPAIDLICPALP
jgi:predicted aspartyl protease